MLANPTDDPSSTRLTDDCNDSDDPNATLLSC